MGLTPSAIIFLTLTASCGFVSWILVSREIEEVNRKLPDPEQISLGFMYPGKMQKIKTAYKRLYPDGKIERFRIIAQIAMFLFAAFTAITAGFLK